MLRAIALALRGGLFTSGRYPPRLLPRTTRLRIPSSSICLLSEMRARDEFLIEICWIINDGRDDEPGIAVRLDGAIVILRHNGFFAVRNAVLSQISRTYPGRHNFQRTAGWCATSAPR